RTDRAGDVAAGLIELGPTEACGAVEKRRRRDQIAEPRARRAEQAIFLVERRAGGAREAERRRAGAGAILAMDIRRRAVDLQAADQSASLPIGAGLKAREAALRLDAGQADACANRLVQGIVPPAVAGVTAHVDTAPAPRNARGRRPGIRAGPGRRER